MMRKVTINEKDVYGVERPPVPKGWVDVGFRVPRHGEWYLNVSSREETQHDATRVDWAFPRIILERAVMPKVTITKQIPYLNTPTIHSGGQIAYVTKGGQFWLIEVDE